MKYKDIWRNTGQLLTRSRAGRKDMRGVEKKGAHKTEKVCTQKQKGAPIDDGTERHIAE